MSRHNVLILGAYGLGGKHIVSGLLKLGNIHILASGRNEKKLEELKNFHSSQLLSTLKLDINNSLELAQACQGMDLVINCVGPYSLRGVKIAQIALKNNCSYIDYAGEQHHYRQIRKLDDEAKNRQLMLMTTAGMGPGITTLIMLDAIQKMTEVDSVDFYYAHGRFSGPEEGLGSIMGIVVESGIGTVSYKEGKYVTEKLGANIKKVTMPEPYGEVNMLCMPTADVLLISESADIKSMHTYFMITSKPPKELFTVLKFMKPHKFPWLYSLIKGRMKQWMHQDYIAGVEQGLSSGGTIRLVFKGKPNNIDILFHFNDSGICTSYLPVILTKLYVEKKIKKHGVLIPSDVMDLNSMQNELKAIDVHLDIDMIQS